MHCLPPLDHVNPTNERGLGGQNEISAGAVRGESPAWAHSLDERQNIPKSLLVMVYLARVVAMENHKEHARRLRNRAEECRRLSKLASDDTLRRSYLSLADSYDVLALHEEAPGEVDRADVPPCCTGSA
jgi:hypothetical protein